jgi:peptide/nickel transport system substrate-binding protein
MVPERRPGDQERWRRRAPAMLVTIAFMLSMALTACGGEGSSDDGTPQASSAEVSQVTWAFPGTTGDNPFAIIGLAALSLNMQVKEGLLAYDPDGNLRPAIAQSWREESPTVYTYDLRPGVKFSDGTPLRMEDVLFCLRTFIDPAKSFAAGYWTSVKSVEAASPTQVKITLKHPDPTFKYLPAFSLSGIYSKAAAARAHSTYMTPRGLPVATGPYMATGFTSDTVTLVRNPYYWGEKPKVAKVVVRYLADDATRLAAMQAGDIDGTSFVPLTNTPQWERVPSARLLSTPSNGFHFMFFNTQIKPFDDVHARRAVMYAFNREAVVKQALHRHARVANTVVAPEMWTATGLTPEDVEARSDELGPEYPFDLEKAKAELAASKYPEGFSTEVVFGGTIAEAGLALQIWAKDLEQLNIHLKLRELPDAKLYEQYNMKKPAFGMYVSPGASDFPDPWSVAMTQFQWPNSGYKNPELDRLLAASQFNPNREERVQQLIDAIAIGAEDLPGPTLWWDNSVVVLDKKLVLKDLGPWSILQTPWMADLAAAASE